MNTETRAQSQDTVALILLTMNQRERTLRCLRSINRLAGPRVHVIVLDNGSNDGTVHSIRIAYPHVAVIRSESNLGVAGGRNEAAWEAIHRWGVEFLFFMDNDMEIDPACLLELVAAMRGSDRIASATGKIRIVGEARRLYGAGGCLLDFRNGRTGH